MFNVQSSVFARYQTALSNPCSGVNIILAQDISMLEVSLIFLAGRPRKALKGAES